ncbi:biopolymer transporter TolR [Lysobacter arseniciresistens ZS79]|uniref:Tol-Pal system protein TolR n=1 Tax=Lysobacter arseniciresistens ZS79 TaxID=913325 RepID=A0A0A0F209_9GAMM|nr:protein TolR [Lysobacter arseniciresistens]KGM56605.1 biopolymer transporter TolR [Lysobacter arseniciresistens ZS79]
MTSNGRRVRKRRLKAEINVVPYIDVMLVLLIIFMVTAPLMNLGVEVELPRSDAKSITSKDQDPVVVIVDKDGNYFLTVQGAPQEALTLDQLEAKVGAFSRNNPGVPVYVAGDADARYEAVVQAMARLKKADVARVSLMSSTLEAVQQ